MNIVHLLLGGNLGNVLDYFLKSIDALNSQGISVIRQSSVYQSEPWGFESNDLFLNQVLIAKTTHTAKQVLEMTQNIEKQIGRKTKSQNQVYESRLIDIDILLYDDLVLCSPNLTIPHPRLHERRFTLLPLQEIDADFIHPSFNKSIQALLNECQDQSKVVRLT
jgi:2-amino-4-hydroxy-6-hydroxymethyldihydropteridine diphosphokinase